MAVLAVECSTRAAKALVHDLDRGVCIVREAAYPPETADVATLQTDAVLAAMRRAMSQAAEEARARDIPIEAVGISAIWHSLEILDREDRPLTPMLTWADTRAAGAVESARKDDGLARHLYAKTGCVIHSMYPLWQYRALCEANRELPRRVGRVRCMAQAMMEDLTGEAVLSRSTASGSGLLGLVSGEWDEEILSFAGMDRAWLPQLAEMEEAWPLTEDAARAVGLPAGIPVAVGGPDGALNQVGAGAAPGRMTFSVGTSGALRMACGSPWLPEARSNWCYRLWGDRWIAGAATSGAGSCVSWLRETLLGGSWSFERLEAALAHVDRAHAPLFLPFLFGERCPGWQDARTGEFRGLTGRHGPADLYYAVLEGVLFNIYDCYGPLTAGLGEPEHILLSGGITSSATWRQMAADIFGRTLEYAPGEHTSAVGAAAAAHATLGMLDSPLDFVPPAGQLCHPGKADSIRADRLERYRRAYASGISQ